MGYFSDIFKSDDAPVESDDLEQTAGFFSQERGQARSKALNDAIRYYLGPYLGAENGLLDSGNQLLNPVVGLQDSGVAFREGRYVDAATDLAGAAVPLAGAVVAKPLAKAVANKADDAVDMVSETLTGFSAKPKPFDPSRRKAMTQMGAAAVAAPVLASDAARGVLDEVIAPVVKKTAGAVNPLSQSLGKLDGMATDFQNGFLKGQDIFQRVKEGKYTNYWMTSRSNPELAAHDASMNDLAESMRNEFFDSVVPALTKDNISALKDDELLFAASELSARADDAYIKAADFDGGALAESLDTSIQDVLDELSARGINTPETQKLLDDIEYRKDPYLEGAYAGEDVTTDALGMPPANVAANMVPKDAGVDVNKADVEFLTPEEAGFDVNNISPTAENIDTVLEDTLVKPVAGAVPTKTVKAYKLFRIDPKFPDKLFPLFVDSKTPIEVGVWTDAKMGDQVASTGKVKSKIGPLAFRPGFHAGDLPIAKHIGAKSNSSLTKPDIRPDNQVWAEVEMPDDKDWQSIANSRATIKKDGTPSAVTAHITDGLPVGGHYRYKTNPNMEGNWLIGGSMKVVRVLDDIEVQQINSAAGTSDLPRAGQAVPTSLDAQTDELFGGVDFNEVARVGDNTVPEGNPEFSPTGRISTRMPIIPKKEGGGVDPAVYSGELTIGRDVMEEGGTLKKNMEYLASRREQSDDVVNRGKDNERPLFTSSTPNPYADIGDVPYFPGFKALEGMSVEDRAKFVSAMQQENLEWLMNKIPKEFQDRAKLWYTGANRFSEELASKYGVPRQSMSGVLAALSPQKDWFQNASLGERVADAVINNRNFPWSSEMEAVVTQYPVFRTGGRGRNAAIWESIRGKKYSELETTPQKAMWVRAFDEAHNPKTYRALTPEGDLGDIVTAGNKTRDISWGGFNTIEKAVDALESGGDFNILSDAMGDMHKVRNFFNNIEVPFSDMGDVTIDTHAIAAALMRPLGGDDRLVAQGLGAVGGKDAKTGAKGNYGFIADDYRAVAGNRGLLPRETQSITWEAIRSLFNNKSDNVKRRVNTIWSRVDDGSLTQQQALDLIEAEVGGFPQTQQVLTPRTNRSIGDGRSSTMFAAGGLLTAGAMEEGIASEPEYQ